MLKTVKLTIEYNGTNYCGWQKQPNGTSIQGKLEEAIEAVTAEKVDLNASGRTDAGVHAYGQVASFETESKIEAERIPMAINNFLPKDISVTEAEYVDDDFHARFSAKKKRYMYRFYNKRARSALRHGFCYHVKYNLDLEKMKEEARKLIGVHDFTSFVSSGSGAKSNVREIYDISLYEIDGEIRMEIEGNGFLYNMVRIIAGTLVDIGRGRITEPMEMIIADKKRKSAGHTAPAHGLYLYKVYY